MRRRRNPALSLSNPLTLGLLAVSAFVLYKVWKTGTAVTGALSQASNAVASGIANTFVALTSGPGLTPSGTVVLSNGQEVPIAALANVRAITLPDGTAGATFTYQGTPYQFVGPADETGTYYAFALQ